MSKSEIIENFLKENKVETKVLIFTETTRTSQDAAKQAGCEIGQIAKSIIFRVGDEPVLVITSGPNRVSESKLEKILNQEMNSQNQPNSAFSSALIRVMKADADFVYEKTGFPIGGVPAFCHKTPIKFVFLDEDLIKYEKVWSAAGTPNAIFEIKTQKLITLSNAKVVNIKQ